MSKTLRLALVAWPLAFCLFSASMMAQSAPPQDSPKPADQSQPAPQPPPQPTAPSNPGVPPTMTVAPPTPPPPKSPYVLEDGGIYIQPFYWMASGEPRLRGGVSATNIGDLQFTGSLKGSIGAEIGVPAGRSNTVRITLFRVQANSGFTLPKDAVVFGEQYYAGYFLNSTYKLQSVKASWDYLSYTWHTKHTNIHIKTLWELQYLNGRYNTAPPFVLGSADTTGNGNLASGSTSLIMPEFGMAMGSQLGKYFRWDIRGSGFGIAHRLIGKTNRTSDIADLDATIAFRVSKVELVLGEKFLYFKTSPARPMYTNEALQGVYGGLRFILNRSAAQ